MLLQLIRLVDSELAEQSSQQREELCEPQTRVMIFALEQFLIVCFYWVRD
jgi:hypothetical protein